MKNTYATLFFFFITLLRVSSLSAQCSRTPLAALSCPISTGTAIVADGVTNNNVHGSGAIFYYNGSGGSAKISMTNDGILDICGSLTVTSSSTFNLSSGGTIKVEPGGSLTINTNVTLNNTGQIVNRGTLIINGDLSMTNVNATVWNLGSAPSFTIGTGYLMKIGAGYFINSAAYSNVTIPTLQITGGFMCLGDNTTVYTQTFINSTTNSVLYSGTTFPACLSVQNSAQLSGTMTSSSYIGACLASGFSYTSGMPVIGDQLL